MNSGIYQIRNIINDKRYIGSAKDFSKRKSLHFRTLIKQKHRNRHLQNAWNKYGENAFVFEIIEYCEPDQLLVREQWYFDNWNPEYNIYKTAGSGLGHKMTEEMKKFLSKLWTGRIISLEQKLKLSISNSGERNFWFGKFGEHHIRFGTKHSEETRLKISLNRSGKMVGRDNHRSIPVHQIDLETNQIIKTFESMCLASKETHIPQANIWKVCYKKRKHAGGFGWILAENLSN